jgi:hypothetical protein
MPRASSRRRQPSRRRSAQRAGRLGYGLGQSCVQRPHGSHDCLRVLAAGNPACASAIEQPSGVEALGNCAVLVVGRRRSAASSDLVAPESTAQRAPIERNDDPHARPHKRRPDAPTFHCGSSTNHRRRVRSCCGRKRESAGRASDARTLRRQRNPPRRDARLLPRCSGDGAEQVRGRKYPRRCAHMIPRTFPAGESP